SEELTSELQSLTNLVCRLLLEKKDRSQFGFEPIERPRLGQCLGFKDQKIDLILDRQAIAAIDEDHGARFEHDGKPRRTGKAGEPGEALFASGDIFVLVFVGARNQKPIQPKANEFGTQGRDSRGALRRIGLILEGLIEAFKHFNKLNKIACACQRNLAQTFWLRFIFYETG